MPKRFMSTVSYQPSLVVMKNFSLEISRIEHLIQNVLDKLEFALLIPIIIEKHYSIVSQSFAPIELVLIKKAFSKYMGSKSWTFKEPEERGDFSCLRSNEELEKYFNEYKPIDETLTKDDERNMSKVIQLFYEKPEMRELAQKLRHEMSLGASNFIRTLRAAFDYNIEEMRITPEEAAEKEENLKKIFNRYSTLSDYSNFAMETKETQFNQDISYFDKRIKELREWEIKIENMKTEAKDYINQIQEETDEELKKDIQMGEAKQKALLVEIDADTGDLEVLRKKHVDEEKELRVRRFKTEQQLINVLRIYDRDLMDRQTIYEGKKAALEEEKKLLKEFQEKYDNQTEVYNALKKEMQDYEDKIVQGKLYEIRCKMAARKIQRCFKRYQAIAGMRKSTKKTRKSRRK